MSDFSKQLGKVIDFIENYGVSASSSDFDKTESRAKAKASLTDLIIKTIEEAIDGQEIDIEATEKHIESTGVTGDELEMAILSARIDHDDRHDTLNDVRTALIKAIKGESNE